MAKKPANRSHHKTRSSKVPTHPNRNAVSIGAFRAERELAPLMEPFVRWFSAGYGTAEEAREASK